MPPCPVHDEAFRRIEEKIEAFYNRLNDKLDQLIDSLDRGDVKFRQIDDRLARLEQWKWYLIGAVGVLAVFSPIILRRLGIE